VKTITKSFCLGALFFSFFAWAPWAFSATVPPAPKLDVYAYILIDADSGMVLAEHNADKRLHPASITKMMTSYIVDEQIRDGKIRKDQRVPVSRNAVSVQRVRMFHKPTNEPTVEDLVQGVSIQSANDASVALAEFIAGSEDAFVDMMNDKAEDLGMRNTRFANPHGLTESNHYSSARDLSILARALVNDFPETYPKYSRKSFTYKGQKKKNPNLLLWWDESVDGIKTGYTHAAKFCLASSAKRGDMRLIAVVLGSKTVKARTQQSQALLDYGFRYYETQKVHEAYVPVSEARIWMGNKKRVELGLEDDLYVTLPKGEFDHMNIAFNVNSDIKAPVLEKQPCGHLAVKVNEEVIDEKPLVALEPVKKGGWWRMTADRFRLSMK
jgi:serine-type D-Ala-D-Ala carboxypeptidase (penicillin-binding protein 5/6)